MWKIERRIRRSIRRINGASPTWGTKATYRANNDAMAAFNALVRKARYRDQFRLVAPDGRIVKNHVAD